MPPDLETDTGFVNPVMVAQAAVAAMAEQEGLKTGLEKCIIVSNEISETLAKCMSEAKQSDGTLNWDKISAFGGSSSQEKQDKIIELNSRLAGTTKAIAHFRKEAHEKEEAEKLAEANATQGVPEDALQQVLDTMSGAKTQLMSDALTEAVKAHKEGLDLGTEEFRSLVENIASGGGAVTFDVAPKLARGPNKNIMATLFQTTSWEPNKIYEPGWLPKVNTPISLTPIFHSGPMMGKNYSFWEETTYTNAATVRAEGAAAKESAYELTERTYVPVSIAHYLPITEEALEDRMELEDYVDYVMPLGVLQAIDQRLANGTEDAFTGVLQKAGTDSFKYEAAAQAATVGAITNPWDVLIDAKFQGMQHGFGILGMQMPTHCAVHPQFWLQCLKSKSESGGYFIGGPGASGLFAAPWGMELVASNHFSFEVSEDAAANHKYAGFVGDMSPMFSKLCYRHGIMVRFGMINDDFIKFRLAVRAEMRGCLVIKRPGAFVKLVNPKADGTGPDD